MLNSKADSLSYLCLEQRPIQLKCVIEIHFSLIEVLQVVLTI